MKREPNSHINERLHTEPYLIAGRYTLAELIVPNGKAARA